MSGNEAIARGAYEAGVKAASAYPGTPSTEILEYISRYNEIYSEWAPNEKVAVEMAQGSSLAGARSLVAMKHVGVNVAADPLFSFAYTGVNGGFLVVSADDPGMHSSQNEQDNRYYAKFMKIGLLEPSNSQEAKDYVKAGLELSEKFDIPFMLRSTTRISHSKSLVDVGERQEVPLRPYEKNIPKYVVVPANARKMRLSLEDRMKNLEEFANTFPHNRVEGEGTKFAVITSGISYEYAKEALGDEATFLKLSLTHPFPRKLVEEFLKEHETVYVVEEGEPYMEEAIRNMGYSVHGKDMLPTIGELSVGIIRHAFLGAEVSNKVLAPDAPMRPPVMCPGCPHRGVFYVLKRLKTIVTSDIGCYTLGGAAPLQAIDTSICMGASIGNALGMSKMLPDKKIVATIGDSTFIHSGITGLIDVVYNKGKITLVILDNSITGMTGQQDHPGTGYTIKGEPTYQVNLEQLVRACGVQKVWIVNSYDLKAVEEAMKEALNCDETTVVITKQPCVLIDKKKQDSYNIKEKNCKMCKVCLQIGCPAIELKDGKIQIDQTLCTGCAVCEQVCRFDAICKGETCHD